MISTDARIRPGPGSDEGDLILEKPSDPSLSRVRPAQVASSFPEREVREAVEKLRFGTVQIIIQDGRVVQIDTTEKRRLA